MNFTEADVARILRMVGALRETAAAAARLSPDWADDARFAADFLAGATTTLRFVLRAAPASPPPRLLRHAQVLIARSWFLTRLETWPQHLPPPSAKRDWLDAGADPTMAGVSRAVLRRQRPVEWQLRRGRRCKSPRT